MKKVISGILLVLTVFILVGCDNKEIKNDEPKDLKLEEITKLKQALTDNGFIENEENAFKKVYAEKYDDTGKIIILNVEYFNIDSLSVSKNFTNHNITRTSLITDYSFRTNVGTGSLVFFDDKGEWENKYDLSYDFNSGISNCKALFGTCTEKGELSSLKNEWLSFITNKDINIELLK